MADGDGNQRIGNTLRLAPNSNDLGGLRIARVSDNDGAYSKHLIINTEPTSRTQPASPAHLHQLHGFYPASQDFPIQ